ncbi:MAG: hypothetical protein HYU34_02610 [Candidatus Omnitrophica bacterium]|nr:hypothetical protein [Candidatus Omnitrophota bacterium]
MKKIALKQRTSLSALAEKALLFYLVEDDDCRIALHRLRDRNDLMISRSDLRKRLRFPKVNCG